MTHPSFSFWHAEVTYKVPGFRGLDKGASGFQKEEVSSTFAKKLSFQQINEYIDLAVERESFDL